MSEPAGLLTHEHVGLSPFPSGAQFCVCGKLMRKPYDRDAFLCERIVIAATHPKIVDKLIAQMNEALA